jgi:hypothetical protein
MFIPESLLNLYLLAYCDIAVALIAIIFQVYQSRFFEDKLKQQTNIFIY